MGYLLPVWTDGVNPTKDQFNLWRDTLRWEKGASPDYVAATISAAAADQSFNDSAAGFPLLTAGDIVTSSGFSNGANNGIGTVITSTAAKLTVSGMAIVNEAAGATVTIASDHAYTERDAEIQAPEFIHVPTGFFINPELRHTFTGAPGGSEFRFIRNVLAAAFANGQSGQLQGSASDTDDGLYEILAWLKWIRTGSAAGSLEFDTSSEAGVHSNPALKIDSAGNVHVAGGTGGAYNLTVNGSVRAAGFRKAGAALGKWILETLTAPPTMTYNGAAEAKAWSFFDAEVDSTTKCTNVNAEKLRGYDWDDQLTAVATASGVTCPARFGTPTFTAAASPATWISAAASDNSFNSSQDPWFPFDSPVFGPGSTLVTTGFAEPQNNGTFTIVSMTATKIVVAGGTLTDEAEGQSVVFTYTGGYTDICSLPPVTRAGYYILSGEISIPIASPGNTAGLFVAKLPGAPASTILGSAYTQFYCSGKIVGEMEQLKAGVKYRAAEGEVLTLQMSNTTEAEVTVQGSLVAKWDAGGEDIFPVGMALTLTLGSPVVT